MDASKAMQAIREGDLYAMVEALDVDESIEIDIPFPCGVDRMRMSRVGVTLVSVLTDGHPHEGNHPHAEIVNYGTVEEARQRLQETLTGSQMSRGMRAAIGHEVGILRYNGVEIAPPQVTGVPIHDGLIDEWVARHPVPDDASGIIA
jgi:hypothetical protein